MKCSVGPCQGQAVVQVAHHPGLDRWTPYCRYHAYTPSGDLRWGLYPWGTHPLTRHA